MYDLIIIGASAAGVSASIYAARRRLNFKIITADKSNTALARAEGLRPLYVHPPSFDSRSSFVEAPKIGESGKEIKMEVPIGKLIYEMAVQFEIIEIRDETKKKISFQSDCKGDSLDHWIYRQLEIDQRDLDIILNGYKGKFSLQKITDVKKWHNLTEKFIEL